MKSYKFIFLATVMLFLSGCASTHYVDTSNDDVVTMGLSYRDFEYASNKAVEDILASRLLVHPQEAQGARYVIAVSSIVNDTMQRIDTDQLSKKIRTDLLRSGRFITTTAIGIDGPEDKMTAQVRQLSQSKLINQSTVKKQGAVIAPDFSLSGKIIQRNHSVSRYTQQVDYYMQLTLTNLENGLAYYEGEYPIIKRGSNRSVAW